MIWMGIIGSFCHLIEFQINDRRVCNSPCRNRSYANASGWPRRGCSGISNRYGSPKRKSERGGRRQATIEYGTLNPDYSLIISGLAQVQACGEA